MPLRSTPTTGDYDAVRLDKPNAHLFSFQIANQPALIQLNVSPTSQDELWMPTEGIEIRPGYWTMSPEDFEPYGVTAAHGIRFKSAVTEPAIITAN